MDIEIRRGSIVTAESVALIQALNAELSARYPEEGATHFRLDPEEVADGRGAFLVVRSDGRWVGCGAVRRIDERTGEIKRMYVAAEFRGNGIARRLLDELEAESKNLGLSRLVLETGERQPEALALYMRAGFMRIAAFGEYADSPLSVCMAKELTVSKPSRSGVAVQPGVAADGASRCR
jgi:putative acetyltransferase